MPLDPEKLLNYPIPEVSQAYTRRDVIFYALSIGLGQDPLDERQLDFVDHHRRLKVFPTLPVVLAHPGFWLARPDTGVDAVKVVHGEQGIRWLKPLPVEGKVRGRTRITGLIDKGKDKGAPLYSEKHLFDETGETLAILSSTTFLRGDGGFGGPTGPVKPVHPIPDRPPELVLDLPTRPEQALYYRLNGDDNPLHADPEVARRAGFPRPILHAGSAHSALSPTPCSVSSAITPRRRSRASSSASPPRFFRARPSAPRSGRRREPSAPVPSNATSSSSIMERSF